MLYVVSIDCSVIFQARGSRPRQTTCLRACRNLSFALLYNGKLGHACKSDPEVPVVAEVIIHDTNRRAKLIKPQLICFSYFLQECQNMPKPLRANPSPQLTQTFRPWFISPFDVTATADDLRSAKKLGAVKK